MPEAKGAKKRVLFRNLFDTDSRIGDLRSVMDEVGDKRGTAWSSQSLHEIEKMCSDERRLGVNLCVFFTCNVMS